MAEVKYDKITDLITEMKSGNLAPVYLVYGEEFLCKNALERLLDILVPGKERSLNYESVDGAVVSAEEVVGRLNTFPLFSGSKVVALHGTQVFYSKASVDGLAAKSMEAFDEQDLATAARYFVNMLSLAGLSLDDARQGGVDQILKVNSADGPPLDKEKQAAWINQVFDFCRGQRMAIPTDIGAEGMLEEAIVSGFPKRNHLVLICDFVDKRKRIFKTIKQAGVVVDCSIPQGAGRVDERQRMTLFKEHARKVMSKAGKTGAPGLVEALYEKTGANLRGFDSEMRKLIAFVGQRDYIEPGDVAIALEKTRQDPIYELGNAVGERDVSKALHYAESLLSCDFHPLQILSAVANQVRKLVLGKDLLDRLLGGRWDDRLDYAGFQKTVWPQAKAMDGKAGVKNMHPYVLYKTLEMASNYKYEQLAQSFVTLLDADKALKSGGKKSKLILERAIIEICAPVTRQSSEGL